MASGELRDVIRVQDFGTMELLMQLLAERSAGQRVYAGRGVIRVKSAKPAKRVLAGLIRYRWKHAKQKG